MSEIKKTPFDFTPNVYEKYGKSVRLTKENAMDIYKMMDCNTPTVNSALTDYLVKNFSEEIILNRNDSFIQEILDEIDRLMAFDGIDTIRELSYQFYKAVKVFTKNKKIYESIIGQLCRYFEKFGYFMNYHFLDVDPDCRTFALFRQILIMPKSDRAYNFERYSTGSIFFYYPDIKYKGLLPALYYLGYTELFEKCVKEVVKPIYRHYQESSGYMKKYKLEYFNENKRAEDDGLFKLLDDFVRENGIRSLAAEQRIG